MPQPRSSPRITGHFFRSTIGLLSVGIGVLFSAMPLMSDDTKKTADVVIEHEEISPKGHPPSLSKPADAPTVYLWQEGDDTWRLRVRTKKQKHEFTGVIKVNGGKLVKIFDFTGLEAGQKKRGKNKKTEDFGKWNDARTQIDFKFLTQGGEDGFAFKVDPKVESVMFDLKTDNARHAEQIRIGLKEKNPPSVPFTLSNKPKAADKAGDKPVEAPATEPVEKK